MNKKMSEKEANHLYNKILRQVVVPLIGNKTTYQNDLERAGIKALGLLFKGVYPSDKIPPLNNLKPYAILNLDRSSEAGSHWVAVAFDGKADGVRRRGAAKNKTYLYDSFGRKGIKIIPSLFHSGNGRIVDTDYDAEQTEEETNCGARSLAWLLFFDRYGPKNAMLI
jgi:hypothetical protein